MAIQGSRPIIKLFVDKKMQKYSKLEFNGELWKWTSQSIRPFYYKYILGFNFKAVKYVVNKKTSPPKLLKMA